MLLVYENYYRFRQQPFGPTPDPEFLYRSEVHQETIEQIARGIKRREGMMLLTGDVGTGKTTTTRALLQLLDADVFIASIRNPFVGVLELLRSLLLDFEVVVDGPELREAGTTNLIEILSRFLVSLDSVKGSALVVVDEAQNLSPPVIEQLRVLTTLETDQRKLLQILLVGQPELEVLLAEPKMSSVNQRIARRCRLRPLYRDELDQYVDFRLRTAKGTAEPLFTSRALDLVHGYSRGVPRRINQLCDRALEEGYLSLTTEITESLIHEAANALGLSCRRENVNEVTPRKDLEVRPVRRWSRILFWIGVLTVLCLVMFGVGVAMEFLPPLTFSFQILPWTKG